MPRQLQPCGTTAAYRRHIRAREEPCGPCKAANRDAKRNEANPPLSSAPAAAGMQSLSEAIGAVFGQPSERSAKADLEWARDQLVNAITVTAFSDPTRIPALVRELRETWKALGGDAGEEAAQDDEFTRALKAREAARATGS